MESTDAESIFVLPHCHTKYKPHREYEYSSARFCSACELKGIHQRAGMRFTPLPCLLVNRRNVWLMILIPGNSASSIRKTLCWARKWLDNSSKCYRCKKDACWLSQLHTKVFLEKLNPVESTILSSFGYTEQLTVHMLHEQDVDEWFTEKKGYDVNFFRIVHESSAEYGIQFNYIYRKGTKNVLI